MCHLAELKTAFCKAPFGLTEAMVVLYVCSLVKTGGFELVLNAATPITLSNEKPLPGNRLTTHALATVRVERQARQGPSRRAIDRLGAEGVE